MIIINGYTIRIEVSEEELKQILSELAAAQEKIYDCYDRLNMLGVLTIKEKTTSGN